MLLKLKFICFIFLSIKVSENLKGILKSGETKVDRNKNMEISEDPDVFSKHLCDESKSKTVQFNSVPNTILITIDRDDVHSDVETANTNNDDVARIAKMETIEQVQKERNLLLQELNRLEKKSHQGHDVSREAKKL
jgi:hypothetical protein